MGLIEAHESIEKGKILKYGMVGGGPGSFIGAVHRDAINLEGTAVLVAGCFSDIKEEIIQAGQELGVDESRVYMNYAEMAEKEAERDDKIDFAVIVTPNKFHYDACRVFLEKGISVMCEKPLTTSLEEATDLKKIAYENGCLMGVAYVYCSHVMAMEARNIIMRGDIGDIKVVMGEYPQEWLVVLI